MTLAIMQPYFFPYIGYWQLINAVDTFVIYDDVTFIKQGYINRNTILIDGKAKYLTLELIGASSNKRINEIKVGNNSKKLLKTLRQNYSKAPYFDSAFPIIEDVFNQEEKNLAVFIGRSIEKISKYLDINTNFIYSSNIEKDNTLKAQDKVLNICRQLGAKQYINAIGGQGLYDRKEFKLRNITLNFLKPDLIEYKQFTEKFVPSLSIIDVMMFNSKKNIQNMLSGYKLI